MNQINHQIDTDIAKEFMQLTLGFEPVESIDEIFNRYLQFAKFNKRLSAYNRDEVSLKFWKRFFVICDINNINQISMRTVNDFVSWRCELHKNHDKSIAKRTINIDLATIRKTFNWAANMELIQKNPIKKIILFKEKGRDLPEYLEVEEIQIIEELAQRNNPNLYDIIAVLVRTGLRSGELCGLESSNVDLKNSRMILHPHQTKGNQFRVIPLDGITKEILIRHIAKAERNNSQYIFPTRSGAKNTPGNINRRFHTLLNYAEKQGIIKDQKRFHIHVLRATYISHLIMAGEDPIKVMAIVGHLDYKTMRRYLVLSREYLKLNKELPY